MLTGDLISRTGAPGAQVNANGLPINPDGGRLHIREPGSSGMLFGMADPVAEAQGFAAHIAFDSQFITS